MHPEQAALFRKACTVFDEYLKAGQMAALSAAASELPDHKIGADAMLIASVAMGTMLRFFWGAKESRTEDISRALRGLIPSTTALLPDVAVNWEETIQLAAALEVGGAMPDLRVDTTTVFQTGFSIAMGAARQYATMTGISPIRLFALLKDAAKTEELGTPIEVPEEWRTPPLEKDITRPDPPSESVEAVVTEFESMFHNSLISVAFAITGFAFVSQDLKKTPKRPEDPDPTLVLITSSKSSSGTRSFGDLPLSQAIERVQRHGQSERMITQQWLVYLYSAWEDEYRQRLAIAHGHEDKNDLKFPILGDLRYLRNDIVHHRGVASKKNTGKCTVLQGWFFPGDDIILTNDHLTEFAHLFPWPLLRQGPGWSDALPMHK